MRQKPEFDSWQYQCRQDGCDGVNRGNTPIRHMFAATVSHEVRDLMERIDAGWKGFRDIYCHKLELVSSGIASVIQWFRLAPEQFASPGLAIDRQLPAAKRYLGPGKPIR